MADTAVLETQDTAVEQVAPPSLETPETVTDALTPETETAPETPETGQPTPPPDPLAEVSDEDLQKHPKLQKLLEGREARVRESVRRQLEYEQGKALQQQRQQESYQYLTQGAYQEIEGIVALVEEGNDYDPNAIAGAAQRLAASVVTQTARHQRDSAVYAITQAAPGVQVPPQIIARLDDAMFSGDPAAAMSAVVSVTARATELALREKLRAEVEAEYRQKQAAAAETERLRAARANALDGPTAGLPTAGSTPAGNNRLTLDSAPPGSAQWRAAYKAEYGIDPP